MCRIYAKVKPRLSGFVVAWNVVQRVASKIGDVESLLWEVVDFGQKFPAESDGFFLQKRYRERGKGGGENQP